MTADERTDMSTWLHLMPRLPVSDMERSVTYYEEALGFRLAWRTDDGTLAALSSGDIEVVLLVPWSGDGRPPTQSAYVYVEDPDALCAEYQDAEGWTSSTPSLPGRTGCETSSFEIRTVIASPSGAERRGCARWRTTTASRPGRSR